MKKRLLLITMLFVSIIVIAGCTNNKKGTEDNIKFKEEYESLNGQVNASGKEYRTVSIPKDNPFVYATGDEIVKKIENNETFFVYFGDTMCPWCRSVIEKAIEVAKEYDIDKIYYVRIWDDEHNEILRDVYSINDEGTAEKTQNGTDSYYKLLKYLDSVLSEYNLTDEDGNKVDTNEKRIYAPNYVFIKSGKPQILVEGISELQTDPREELTDEILEDEYEAFDKLFSASTTCDSVGC